MSRIAEEQKYKATNQVSETHTDKKHKWEQNQHKHELINISGLDFAQQIGIGKVYTLKSVPV